MTARECSRRNFLKAGAATGLAAGFTDLTSGKDVAKQHPTLANSPGFGRAKSVILIFANGGQSQLETWDPKPNAPLEVRGDFRAIASKVPGTILSEHLPRTAQLADRFTIIRTMSHEDLDHGSAAYLSFTGRYHNRKSSNPPPRQTDIPCMSAVLKRVRPQSPFVDAAVHINAPAIIAPNNLAPGQFGGLLGRKYDALTVGNVTAGSLVIPGLTPRPDLSQVRLQKRRSLLRSLDDHARKLERYQKVTDMRGLYDRAYRMLSDRKTRQAFDLTREPEQIRNRYGRNRSGQACLLARRLTEAGVPFTTVMWNHHSRGQDHEPNNTDLYGWDTHNDIFTAMKNRLLPRFDLSFSALIEDLDQRGLLDTTLVICMGEFGRAPLVALEKRFKGASPGRKHWAATYSVVMAGAGVGRGKVLGRSDRFAAYPAADAYGPWDITATIFHAMGIDPKRHFFDTVNRPWPISIGKPILKLFA
ncbi:MAG: DUF1501 domain-containing protein [Planctomycetaceae bacterium]